MNAIMLESCFAAVRSLRMNRGRSLLTALGIAVGVAATIIVVSIIAGFSNDVNARFEGFGANSITIQPRNSFDDQLKGRFSYLKYSELDLISRRVSGISNITPEMSVFGQFRGAASYKGKSIVTDVRGTSSTWQDLMRIYPEKGRFFVPSDDDARRRVGIVGKTVVAELKLPANPIGEFIQVGTAWVKIIGVLEERGKSFGIDQDDVILVPFETGRSISSRQRDPSFWIQMQVDDPGQIDAVVDRIKQVLRESRGIGPDEDDDFDVQTATQFMDAFNEMTMSISLISAGIMAISMLVGGIGIMNMMLVSVAERTREIGILKAIGASRGWIVLMFISEAVLLSLVGCVLGVLLSVIALSGIGLISGFPEPVTPAWAVAVAVLFCVAIGAFFGVVPAVKAANMEPIEAIRHQ